MHGEGRGLPCKSGGPVLKGGWLLTVLGTRPATERARGPPDPVLPRAAWCFPEQGPVGGKECWGALGGCLVGLWVWYRWERPELIYVPTERIQTQKDAILIKFGVSQSFSTSRTHGMYLNGTRVKGRDQSWSEVTPGHCSCPRLSSAPGGSRRSPCQQALCSQPKDRRKALLSSDTFCIPAVWQLLDARRQVFRDHPEMDALGIVRCTVICKPAQRSRGPFEDTARKEAEGPGCGVQQVPGSLACRVGVPEQGCQESCWQVRCRQRSAEAPGPQVQMPLDALEVSVWKQSLEKNWEGASPLLRGAWYSSSKRKRGWGGRGI